jgi:hypothetical protein
MKVIDKISSLRIFGFRIFVNPKKNKNKGRVLIKSKFGLPTFRVCGVVLVDTGTTGGTNAGVSTSNAANSLANTNASNATMPAQAGGFAQSGVQATQTYSQAFRRSDEVTDIYLKENEDAKDLISSLNGIVSIRSGVANDRHEVICVTYNNFLDLNMLMKIYSFTSGDKKIFAQNSKQKEKYLNILNSKNISSTDIDIVDLISFE